MKKNDIILIIVIGLIACAGLLYMNWNKTTGDKVIVRVDGEIYKELPLNKDDTIEIEGVNGTNLLVIKDGQADVVEASCPDSLCVNQHEIKNNGETIVCLPNKVVVEIQSKDEGELDIIVR